MTSLLKQLRTVTLASVAMSGLIIAPIMDASVTEQTTTESITARIVEAKGYTESYVLLSKKALEKNPADLEQAESLYAKAYSKYNAWVAYVKTSLEAGRVKHLATDADYKQLSTDAATAGKQFTDFVDSKTGESRAVTAILSSLGALGIQLWNGIKDRVDTDRAIAATNFEQETKWSLWDGITANSDKPTPSTLPGTAKTKPDAATGTKPATTTPKKPDPPQ